MIGSLLWLLLLFGFQGVERGTVSGVESGAATRNEPPAGQLEAPRTAAGARGTGGQGADHFDSQQRPRHIATLPYFLTTQFNFPAARRYTVLYHFL